MENIIRLIVLSSITLTSITGNAKVRRVLTKTDQIVTVKTALGIATLIQVPDRPNSIVIGDSEAFKVEYLDQAITIKPLQGSARSNLYIYTDYRRYSVQLLAGSEALADYIVYLDNPAKQAEKISAPIRWKAFRKFLKNESLSLEVKRIGQTMTGILFLEFKIDSLRNEKIDPKWFWLVQNGITKPIHRLILSQLEVDSKHPVEGVIQILKSDLKPQEPIRLELRRQKISYLTLPKADSWR